jgi:imidazolonepropionase-like amidohydrolase
MRERILLVALCLLFTACESKSTSTGDSPSIKVLIGATVLPVQGGRPLLDSVIVIEDGKIRAVGERKYIPIPQDSERSDVTGMWFLPEPGKTLIAGQPADMLVMDGAPVGDVFPNSEYVRHRIKAGVWVD